MNANIFLAQFYSALSITNTKIFEKFGRFSMLE